MSRSIGSLPVGRFYVLRKHRYVRYSGRMSTNSPSPVMRRVGRRAYCNVESGVTLHGGPGRWEIYRPGPNGQEHFQTEWYFDTARRKARDLAAQIIASTGERGQK